MRYHALIPLIAAVSCLGLAAFVRKAGPRTNLSSVFVFLALTLVFWNLNFLVLYFVRDYDLALTLTDIFRVGAFFVPPAVLHLSIVLGADERSPIWRHSLLVSYLTATTLTVANACGYFVAG